MTYTNTSNWFSSEQGIQLPVLLTLEEAVFGVEKEIIHPDTGQPLDIKIPPGVTSGVKMRLAGQGRTQAGSQQRGNLFIILSVTAHPLFTRVNDDLILDVPVEARLAKSGGQIRLPQLHPGKDISLIIPAGLKNGATLRIQGGGACSLKNGKYGDLILRIETYHAFWKSPRIRKQLELIQQALKQSMGQR